MPAPIVAANISFCASHSSALASQPGDSFSRCDDFCDDAFDDFENATHGENDCRRHPETPSAIDSAKPEEQFLHRKRE